MKREGSGVYDVEKYLRTHQRFEFTVDMGAKMSVLGVDVRYCGL